MHITDISWTYEIVRSLMIRVELIVLMRIYLNVIIISSGDLTIKGGSRRAEKKRKVLLMIKAAKLGWAEERAGQEQGLGSRGIAGAGAEQEQSWGRAGEEQD